MSVDESDLGIPTVIEDLPTPKYRFLVSAPTQYSVLAESISDAYAQVEAIEGRYVDNVKLHTIKPEGVYQWVKKGLPGIL